MSARLNRKRWGACSIKAKNAPRKRRLSNRIRRGRQRHAAAEWAHYVATPIELDDFVECWLSGMHQDGLLAGVNFNADLAGLEVEPIELGNALVNPPPGAAQQ